MSPEFFRRFFKAELPDIQFRGNQGTARCCFHPDRRASLSVNIRDGLFYCHACKAKGDWKRFKRLRSRRSLSPSRKGLAQKKEKWNRGRIVKTYAYHDADGKLLYEQVRFDPKDFRFRRPDGAGSWHWNLMGIVKVPYRLPEVSKSEEVYVVEGEKDADTIHAWGLCATCNPGGAGKWSDDYSKLLKDKQVVVLQDADAVGQQHALAVAQSIAKYASVKLLRPFKGAKDVTEWVEKGGTREKLRSLVSNAARFYPNSSHAVLRDGPRDWRDRAMRGKWLLQIVESVLTEFVVLPSGSPLAIAIWALGTNVFEIFDCFPYLSVTSPTKRCGKTRLGEVLEQLCARSLMTVNVSEAALFRLIEKDKPTLIIDEAEPLSHPTSERSQNIRALLQAGFRKGAVVPRCVGREHEVKQFSVYCPKAVLAIGSLPDTIRDRSLLVPMRRKRKQDHVLPFRLRKVRELGEGMRHAMRVWCEEHCSKLEAVYASIQIDFLRDRDADIWEPLFSILQVCDPTRTEELKRIAMRMSNDKNALDVDDSLGLRLLSDIKAVFKKRKQSAIGTSELLKELQLNPENPWEDLTPLTVARLLRPFGIFPKQLWLEGGNVHGYECVDIKPAFERYLEEKE